MREGGLRDGLCDGGGKADSASPWGAARNPGARRDMPCSLLKAGREPASASASVLRESPRPAPADADKTEPFPSHGESGPQGNTEWPGGFKPPRRREVERLSFFPEFLHPSL